MKYGLFLVSVVPMVTVISCASQPERRAAQAPATVQSPPPSPTATQQAKDPDTTRASVAISDDIAKACGLSKPETLFAFNSANVDAKARRVLGKLADCFAKGPLKGRAMRLVGHADPRGDEEYNLVLGGRRADSVRGTLEQLGLPGDRMSTSSRGEMDADGTDEGSWARDRRVDILLGS
jgi:peptidoglycan-associated lipoprotein